MFDLKIGFKCNNNCVHCVVADKRSSGDLNIPHIMQIVNKIPAGEEVQVTGGEPTVVPYLPELLKTIYEKKHPISMQTNGTGFADNDFFRKCKPYLNHVHIAIHSCYPEIHDKIVGSEGMWEKTIRGFENILACKEICCTTQTVLSSLNIGTLYDTFKFISSKKSDIFMSMTYPHMMGNAMKNKDIVAFRYSDYKEEIQRTLKEFGDRIFTEAIPPCYLYPNFPHATAETDILCGVVRDGVDFSDSLNQKNYNLLDISSKRKGPLCKECIFNSKCIGVWKEYIDIFKNRLDLYPIREQ